MPEARRRDGKIYGLPLEVQQEILDRLRHGLTERRVAVWLQGAGHLAELAEDTVYRMIKRFGAENLKDADVVLRDPKKAKELEEKLERRVNEISEMEELARLQIERVKQARSAEEKDGKLLRNTTTEISRAAKILQALQDMKIDVGLLRRQPSVGLLGVSVQGGGQGHIQSVDPAKVIDVAHYIGNDKVAKTMENPRKRRAILEAMRLLEAVDAVDAVTE